MKPGRLSRAGTPTYWAVDPAADPAVARLRAWHLVNGEYAQVADVRGEDAYAATAPYPVTVVPAALVR